MNPDTVAANLSLVEGHFHSELTNDVEKALQLYTDDIVWEAPARKVVFRGKPAVEAMYRKMFAALHDVHIQHLKRIATEDCVVDDSVMTFTLTGDGIDNLNLPVGSRVRLRFVHFFDIRGGKICKETTFEMFEVLS